ncbi:MAG TPA: DUF1501 domain-containing protein [Planctomycetota bacterium]|nr:DUF1501 domain-containing protein [Planctomycetota bacterium]
MMDLYEKFARTMTRRAFLGRASTGIGSMALASLMNASPLRADDSGMRTLHHAPKAKRIIHLYQAGGPSHLETFDYKPKLGEMNGQPMPESFTKGQPIAQLQGAKLTCLAPQHPFRRWGKNGVEMSELFPKLGAVSDEICIVRSLVTEQINHDPAHTFMNTGTSISGRPSMGSWLWYGLGADTDNLPGFVVLTSSGRGGQNQPIATRQWSSGFIPSKYQGVHFRSQGEPVLYLGSPAGVTSGRQRDVIDSVDALNRIHLDSVDDPEIATRISQYEMAFKMQTSVPALMDLKDETEETLKLYGTKGADGSFAANCLLARRLAERGVRFIQLYHRDWDHHGNIKNDIKLKAEEVDGPAAALITDLKRRGMLDETLILYGGEFGRTPMAQGNGRDHHIKGFSCWLAGGGIQGGLMHGATDELGYGAVQDVCHVHDLHATMLHLLGIDHKRLTFKFQGRDFRLTDVHGNVVKKILA